MGLGTFLALPDSALPDSAMIELEADAEANARWTSWTNGWDGYSQYQCPGTYAITGVHSYHHNSYEDRRWAYQCGRIGSGPMGSARWTGWLNNYDGRLYSVGSTYIVKGMASSHHNRYGNVLRLLHLKAFPCQQPHTLHLTHNTQRIAFLSSFALTSALATRRRLASGWAGPTGMDIGTRGARAITLCSGSIRLTIMVTRIVSSTTTAAACEVAPRNRPPSSVTTPRRNACASHNAQTTRARRESASLFGWFVGAKAEELAVPRRV